MRSQVVVSQCWHPTSGAGEGMLHCEILPTHTCSWHIGQMPPILQSNSILEGSHVQEKTNSSIGKTFIQLEAPFSFARSIASFMVPWSWSRMVSDFSCACFLFSFLRSLLILLASSVHFSISPLLCSAMGHTSGSVALHEFAYSSVTSSCGMQLLSPPPPTTFLQEVRRPVSHSHMLCCNHAQVVDFGPFVGR